MTEILRVRKDVIDLRPIPIFGPKNYSYRWKMIALLDFNDYGQYILPFSQRVVDIRKFLWPKSVRQSPLPGFELCGCIDCENKTWTDHLLKDDLDDDVSVYGNLHLEIVHYDMNDKNHNTNTSLSSSHVSEDFNDSNADENNNNYDHNHLENFYEHISTDLSLSPFPCGDPFDSYDLES